MGSYAEFDEVTRMVAGAGVPVIVDEVLDGLEAFPAALDRLAQGDQLGKIVIDHHSPAGP
jgi:NADPH-dependent curcumin reductase CurA